MQNDKVDLKNVLIVGISSTIGEELVKLYNKKGYIVYGTYRNNSADSSVLGFCKETIVLDLEKESHIYKLQDFANVLKPFHIVYLPGIIDHKTLYETNLENLQLTFNVNVFSYLLLISKTANYMKEKKYGRFLSLSSIGSKYGGSLSSFNYTLSKCLLEFFPAEYKNLAQNNVFFNNLICGVTNTKMIQSKKEIDQRVKKIPLKRMAEPIEIARACFNLCSTKNTFQTLTNTTIAGGE